MNRRIVKPEREALILCLDGKCSVAYQWVNWWLYHRGVDDLLKSCVDFDNPWYTVCASNKELIVCELAEMLGIDHPRIAVLRESQQRLNFLLNRG